MKVITVVGKVNDTFSLHSDEHGSYEGYVPSCGLGSDDYIEFDIDNDTGHILNWKSIDLTVFKE